MTRTILLAALLAAYAAVFIRLPAGTFRPAFDPLDPVPHHVEALIVAKRFADALPLAIVLRDRYPREPLIAHWLGRIHHGVNDASAEAAAWEDYVRLSETPEEGCPALPEAYDALDRAADALAAYERCARFDLNDADRLMDLGDAYARHARPRDASIAFERAKANDPENPLIAARLAALSKAEP